MRQTSIFKTIATICFCLAIGLIGGIVLSSYFNIDINKAMANGDEVYIEAGADIADVARAYQNCCVSIKTVNKNRESSFSLGSGVCVHSGGYIVTNYHVINQSISDSNYKIYAYLNGNQTDGYECELLWSNNDLDLAIIKCSYTDISYAKLKDRTYMCEESNKIKIGEEIIAIGTPIEMSLQNTVMFGRVNGLNRVGAADSDFSSVRVYEYLIQHQATLNSGNSGGPLIDEDGYVVGINSCSMVEDKQGEYVANINYAVPIFPIIKILNDIIESDGNHQEYVEPMINIVTKDANWKKYSTSSDFDQNGVIVTFAGFDLMQQSILLKNDIIVGITYDDHFYTINNVYDLYYHCFNAGNGKEVSFKIVRNGSELNTESVELP